MTSEDNISHHVVAAFDETSARQGGYLIKGADVGYVGWTEPGGGSYNQGATFGAFLNRR